MNMQDVLFILENEEKRKDFILRLKQAGEISEEFQAIRNAMSSLRVNKPPREVNQTTILRHAFQYCDGMEAFQNFRLVSKSWKLAVEDTKFYAPCVQKILVQIARTFGQGQYSVIESTKFYAPCVHKILVKIAKKFGQGEYPIIYHKLLKNLKTNPSNFWFYNAFLSNNFNSISKLVCKNMKGLRSISISNNFDVIGDEIYEKFLIEFLPSSKNTLCELKIVKLFLPNVCFPNLTKLIVNDLNLSFDTFKTQFAQILGNVPNLKAIHIEGPNTITPIIRDYLISNYAEQCLISSEGIIPFPVKIIHIMGFDKLVSDWQFKFCVEYVEIFIDSEEPDEGDWNDLKNNIYDFSNLKGIHFYDYEFFQEESNFYKPETNVDPECIQFLKTHGIQILNKKEFESKTEELSKNLKWAFHFGCH